MTPFEKYNLLWLFFPSVFLSFFLFFFLSVFCSSVPLAQLRETFFSSSLCLCVCAKRNNPKWRTQMEALETSTQNKDWRKSTRRPGNYGIPVASRGHFVEMPVQEWGRVSDRCRRNWRPLDRPLAIDIWRQDWVNPGNAKHKPQLRHFVEVGQLWFCAQRNHKRSGFVALTLEDEGRSRFGVNFRFFSGFVLAEIVASVLLIPYFPHQMALGRKEDKRGKRNARPKNVKTKVVFLWVKKN